MSYGRVNTACCYQEVSVLPGDDVDVGSVRRQQENRGGAGRHPVIPPRLRS